MKTKDDEEEEEEKERERWAKDWNAGVMGDKEDIGWSNWLFGWVLRVYGKKILGGLAWKMEPRHAQRLMSKLITRGWFQWSMTCLPSIKCCGNADYTLHPCLDCRPATIAGNLLSYIGRPSTRNF